jgi:hypothetical protein
LYFPPLRLRSLAAKPCYKQVTTLAGALAIGRIRSHQ